MRRVRLPFLSVTTISSCVDILVLLATIRGGVNGLMAEILEDHIRLPMMIPDPDREMESLEELGEELIDWCGLI
jgi:DNA-binding FrmR family transcriptional regulator